MSYNETGSEFLASFEGKRFPIYGTQFHPEKPYSVFSANSGINHSWESISVQRKFGDFFVKKARQSPNTYGTHSDLFPHLIEHNHLINMDNGFADVYVFK